MRKSIISQEELIRLVNEGSTVRQIASITSTCQATVIKALRLYDLKTIVVGAHPNLNIKYFENIDSKEKAYWLGFLYADGCVAFGRGRQGQELSSLRLTLELATKDEERIDRFCEAVCANKAKKSYCTRQEKYYAVSIRIHGEFVKHLAGQGCIPNKTFRMKFPNFGNQELDLAFLLGFYDGDGSAAGSIVCGNISFLKALAIQYNIEDKLTIKNALGSLYIPAVLKRRMFNNYLDSMTRKRKTSIPTVYKPRPGVIKRKEFPWPSNEELARLVWQKPLTDIAKELGARSSNTIKERCIKLNISRPPRGYWRRIESGYSHEVSLSKLPVKESVFKKLTRHQALEIHRMLEEGMKCREIGRRMNICHTTISDIKTGKTHRL